MGGFTKKQKQNALLALVSGVALGVTYALGKNYYYEDLEEKTDIVDIDYQEVSNDSLIDLRGYAYTKIPTPIYKSVTNGKEQFLTEIPKDTLIGTPTGEVFNGFVQLSVKLAQKTYTYWVNAKHIITDPNLDKSKIVSGRYINEIIRKY